MTHSSINALTRRELMLGLSASFAFFGRTLGADSKQSKSARSFVEKRRHRGTLLIRGGRILSMDSRAKNLSQADVLVDSGKIARIEPHLRVEGAEIIDASNTVVMPGFIDGHRHLWEGLLRNALPTQDLAGYLRLVNNTWGPLYSPEDAYLGTLVSALGAIDAGITGVFDWSHIQITPEHTAACISALKDSGLRAVFGYGMPLGKAPNSRWPDDLLRLKAEEFSSADQLLTLALATNSPEFLPDEVARSQFALARQAGVIVSVHAGLRGLGKAGEIGRFGREGLLGPDVNLVHCNTLSTEEWKIISDTGTSVSITPSSEMQMGHGIPAIQAARNVGVKPSLGVDVETTVPGDMWTQMRLIYALQRQNAFAQGPTDQPAQSLMTPHDALEYATLAGARAARLEQKIGSLEVGKDADLIMLKTDSLNVMPVNDLESAVLLNMDARNIDTVVIAGNVMKRHGHILGVDIRRLQFEIDSHRDRIFRDASTAPDAR